MKFGNTMKNLLIVIRYLFAILFIFSGFVKGVDPFGFAYKLTDYFKAFDVTFLEPISLVLSFLLCGAELFVGLLLLFNVRMRLAAWGVFLFMLVFTPLTLVLAIFNPVHDCGCFGDAIKLTNWETFFKNLVFFPASILLLRNSKHLESSSSKVVEYALFVLLIIIALLPPFIGYYRMPLFDFRPYKLGVNITEAMTIPEGAPVDEYRSTLYYQKDGVTKEFNENNIPWQDSTWKFVDSKSVLVKKGYTAPIESFGLMTTFGRDITDSILTYPNYYFLVVAYRLDRTNQKVVSKLNDIYFKAKANGYGFACATASTQGEIAAFSSKTGAEYPFINADETMLKTVIRANPGLILLNKGTIIGQWHYSQLPPADYFNGDLNAKQISTLVEASSNRLSVMLICFVGLLFVVVNYLRIRAK